MARQPKNGHMAVGEWTSGNVGWDGSQISLRRGRLAQGFRSAVPRANAVPDWVETPREWLVLTTNPLQKRGHANIM